MSLRQFILHNKRIHRLTNSWLFGSRCKRRGRGNRIEGRYVPFMRRTTIAIYGDNNIVRLEDGLWDCSRIIIEGSGNEIRLGSGSKCMNSTIWIKGDNCRISFSSHALFFHCDIGASGQGSAIVGGDHVYVGGFEWVGGAANETKLSRIYGMDGCTVSIGDNTFVSDDVTIRNSDSHPILDSEGRQTNAPADVAIGANCWIASGATLLKGSRVAKGSVVGAMSLVTRDFSAQENVLIAGNPAAIRREGIRWNKGEEA